MAKETGSVALEDHAAGFIVSRWFGGYTVAYKSCLIKEVELLGGAPHLQQIQAVHIRIIQDGTVGGGGRLERVRHNGSYMERLMPCPAKF